MAYEQNNTLLQMKAQKRLLRSQQWTHSEFMLGCVRSHQTHYRSYLGRVLEVKRPNQQCQSTEGR